MDLTGPFTAAYPNVTHPSITSLGQQWFLPKCSEAINESSMRPYFLVGVGRVGEDFHALVFSEATCRIVPTMVSKSPKRGCSPSKWPEWVVNGGY